jgi:hypothetical protein
MRKRWIIVGIVVALAASTGGFAWYRDYVSRQLGASVTSWIQQRSAEGYVVDVDIAPTGGSLATVVQQLDNAVITAPGNAWELRLPRLVIAVDTWDPFGVDFAFHGETELRYHDRGQPRAFTAIFDRDAAGFRYNTNGQITAAHLFLLGATLRGPIGIRPELLDGSVRFHLDAPIDHDGRSLELNLRVEDAHILYPGGLALGQSLARANLDAYVTGPLGPGRPSQVLATWRDAGGVLQVTELVADWGPLALTSDGTLALDQQLQPIGAFTAVVRGFNEAVDAAVAARLMTPNQGTATKLWLNARAENDEAGLKVKLPLTIQDGFVSMGPIKLAPMPRIDWQ